MSKPAKPHKKSTKARVKTELKSVQKHNIKDIDSATIIEETRETKKGRQASPSRALSSVYRKTRDLVRKQIQENGPLPHEFLALIAQGELVEQRRICPETGETFCERFYPSFEMRVEAAKIAAPFFAPRLAAQHMQMATDTGKIESAMIELSDFLPD